MNFTKPYVKYSTECFMSKDGELLRSEKAAYIIDLTLVILAAEINNIDTIHLEYYRCGVYIQHPDIILLISKLRILGLVK